MAYGKGNPGCIKTMLNVFYGMLTLKEDKKKEILRWKEVFISSGRSTVCYC